MIDRSAYSTMGRLRTDAARPSRQGYYFPNLKLYYRPISKNASTSTMAQILRHEEALSEPMHDIAGLTTYVPVRNDANVDPWSSSLYRQYSVERIEDYLDSAQHRLLILRNPVHRLISGWVNKFFMSTHSMESLDERMLDMTDEIGGAQVLEAFDEFVESLFSVDDKQFFSLMDGHILPQVSFVSDLSKYNLVASINNLEVAFSRIGIGGARVSGPTVATSRRLNSSPEAIVNLLLSNANLTRVVERYQADYELISIASQMDPSLARELRHSEAPRVVSMPTLAQASVAGLIEKRQRYANKEKMSRRRTGRRSTPPIPVWIYLLCHNEKVLLPHTIEHYRSRIPHAVITVLDNESTDGSVEIAQSLGCRVRSWSSGDQIDDYLFVRLKNEIWKHHDDGWVIVADMDEWLCVTSVELKRMASRGVTVIRTSGWNIVADSDREDLSDLDLHELNRGVHMGARDKLVAFRPDAVSAMNYGIGAHECAPEGRIVLSPRTFLLKHMERLGTPWLRAKFTARTARAQRMHSVGIARHYTRDIEKIDQRQSSAQLAAIQVPLHRFEPTFKRKVRFVLQLVRHGFQTMRRTPARKTRALRNGTSS